MSSLVLSDFLNSYTNYNNTYLLENLGFACKLVKLSYSGIIEFKLSVYATGNAKYIDTDINTLLAHKILLLSSNCYRMPSVEVYNALVNTSICFIATSKEVFKLLAADNMSCIILDQIKTPYSFVSKNLVETIQFISNHIVLIENALLNSNLQMEILNSMPHLQALKNQIEGAVYSIGYKDPFRNFNDWSGILNSISLYPGDYPKVTSLLFEMPQNNLGILSLNADTDKPIAARLLETPIKDRDAFLKEMFLRAFVLEIRR